MRIKKMAIVLFILIFLSCLPFVCSLLFGYRIVEQMEEYAVIHSSHEMAYVSYAALIILLCVLMFPIISDKYKEEMSILSSEKIHSLKVKKIPFKIDIIKNGTESRIYIRRSK